MKRALSITALVTLAACGAPPPAEAPAQPGGYGAPSQPAQPAYKPAPQAAPEAPPPPPGYPGGGLHPPPAPVQPGQVPTQPPPAKSTTAVGDSLDNLTRTLAEASAELDGMFEGVTALSGGGCTTACAALASLERAASGICSLTGDSDNRCENARAVVTKNEARVTSAGCRC